MHVLASHIQGLPVISLQNGETIALIRRPIIEIAKFEVVALECNAARQYQRLAILPQDIRQLSDSHVLVESEEELVEPQEVIRLRQSIEKPFEPIGKLVVSELERRLGRITNYEINLENNRIQRLWVRPAKIKFWFGPEIAIDRTQIVDVTPKRVIVRDTVITASILPSRALPNRPS